MYNLKSKAIIISILNNFTKESLTILTHEIDINI